MMARAMSARSRSYAAVRRRSRNTYAPLPATTPTTMSGGNSHATSRFLRLCIAPGFDQVAEAANGADADAAGLELGAEPRDVHLDRVGGHVLVPRGDGARDLVLADDRFDVGEEVFEDRVLALRKIERHAVHERALARKVDGEGPVLDQARLHRAAAPRERRHARGKLLGRERLGQ